MHIHTLHVWFVIRNPLGNTFRHLCIMYTRRLCILEWNRHKRRERKSRTLKLVWREEFYFFVRRCWNNECTRGGISSIYALAWISGAHTEDTFSKKETISADVTILLRMGKLQCTICSYIHVYGMEYVKISKCIYFFPKQMTRCISSS